MSRNDWETPPSIFTEINKIFNFKIDIAASNENYLCSFYFTEYNNALTHDWDIKYCEINSRDSNIYYTGYNIPDYNCWLNPPYEDYRMSAFMQKAVEQFNKNKPDITIVCLLPANVETEAWEPVHKYAKYVGFFYDRIKFRLNGVEQGTPRFASALAIFTSKSWNLTSLFKLMNIYDNSMRLKYEQELNIDKMHKSLPLIHLNNSLT